MIIPGVACAVGLGATLNSRVAYRRPGGPAGGVPNELAVGLSISQSWPDDTGHRWILTYTAVVCSPVRSDAPAAHAERVSGSGRARRRGVHRATRGSACEMLSPGVVVAPEAAALRARDRLRTSTVGRPRPGESHGRGFRVHLARASSA